MNRKSVHARFEPKEDLGIPRIHDWHGPEYPGSRTMLGPATRDQRFERVGVAQRFVAIAADDVAREAMDRIRALADAKNIDLVIHSINCAVWVQWSAFSDALCALLENSVRASRRGYPVMLETTLTCEGDTLWAVQDLGEGMSAQKLAELGRTAQFGGVARAWSVIEDHRGMLRFESPLGVGTTESIWLPAVAGIGFD